jgi:hypothetical protein
MSQYYVGVKIVEAHPETRTYPNAIAAAAQRAHEANRAYCLSIGDASQPSWDDAPKWQKDSAIAGVKAILADPLLTPEQSHEGWLGLKEEEGWVYGPVKDPDLKQHPCMVPYDQLPEDQKKKDDIFQREVRLSLTADPPLEEGYVVTYPDDYMSWIPKDVFEDAYLPMGEDNDNTVTQEMVDLFTGKQYDACDMPDGKSTIVQCKTASGFMEYGISSCVDPKNYDKIVGSEIALKRIKDVLWKCLGFVVQWGKFGINTDIGLNQTSNGEVPKGAKV